MRYTCFCALLLLSFAWQRTCAQSIFYQPDTSVKVYAAGAEQTLAWCGGFNNPQFTMGDLNNDGKQDLVIFEPGLGVRTFLNIGTAGAPEYRYTPHYEINFPPIFDYLILADYNCDGVPDLFHRGSTGFSVYKGYYNAANELCFTFYQSLYYTNDATTVGLPGNAYTNPPDIPAIVDVDNDGDLDFVSYDVYGGNLNFYKNMRVELGLPCDSIHIELKDRCWGKVYQAFWRTHELHYDCSEAGLSRHASDTAESKKTHQGNTPCLFDYDMDGDYDYLDGSVSFSEMTFLLNGRMEYGGNDSMVLQDTTWQSGGTPIEMPIWPAAFNVDIDQDGKKDLLIAPNALNTSENYKCIWYYKNETTPGSPAWVFQSDTFLIDKTIDLGTAAYPMFFDYNKDGKPDMFVGSDGYFQSDGSFRSRISYYQNTSTAGNPSFTLMSRDFLNIDSFNFAGAAPAVGDIDNDGKADLVIGHSNGTLTYFKNMAASDSVQPVWQLAQLQLTNVAGDTINSGGHAAPFIYDIDKDGKKDLLIGSLYGYLQYYRNTSSIPDTLSLTEVNDKLGKAKADPRQNLGIYNTPFIGAIDNSGTDYILMGSNSGNIYRYDGFQSGDTTALYTMVDSQYSYIDTTYRTYNHQGSSFGIYGNYRSAPAVADIAGDGNYEMVVGDVMGGLKFYKRKAYVAGVIVTAQQQGSVQLYPNPAKDVLNISWSGLPQQDVAISIINMEGQQLFETSVSSTMQHTSIPVASLTQGVYVCVLQSGSNKYYNRFTVIR